MNDKTPSNLLSQIDNLPDGKQPSSQDWSPTLIETDSPFHRLIRHPNYLSHFGDPVIRYQFRDGPEMVPAAKDLTQIYLSANALHDVQTLVHPYYQHFAWAIMGGLNIVLRHVDSRHAPSTFLGFTIRMIIWCLDNGIYKFESLTRDNCNDIRDLICSAGALGLVKLDDRLRAFLAPFHANPHDTLMRSELEQYVSHSKGKNFLRTGLLESKLSIPIGVSEIPSWFYDEVATLLQIDRSRFAKGILKREPISAAVASQILKTLNYLYDLPDGFDKPKFKPFPNLTKKLLVKCGAKEDGRTKNILIDSAVEMMATSAIWVLDYSAHQLELARTARDAYTAPLIDPEKIVNKEASAYGKKYGRKMSLEFYHALRAQKSPEDARRTRRDKAIATKIAELRAAGCDVEKWGVTIKSGKSVAELLLMLQCACLTVIFSNTGRRHMEILHQSHGLTYGALTQSPDFKLHQLRVYIEKTWEDYAIISVNRLVAKAIEVLKEIQVVYRQIGVESISSDASLFGTRVAFGKGLTEQVDPFSYARHMPHWIKFVLGEDAELILAHQWRRFYAVLFFYRFKDRRLTALQKRFFHFDIRMTRVYVTDPSLRKLNDSIAKSVRYREIETERGTVHVIEDLDKNFIKEMLSVEEEAFVHDLVRIVLGKPVSGGAVSMLLAQIKRYTDALQFDAELIDEDALVGKLQPLAKDMMKQGRRLTPMAHGTCLARVDGIYENSEAKCATNGKIDQAEASCTLCGNCPNHLTHESTIEFLDAELATKRNMAKSSRIPPLQRDKAKLAVKQLEAIRELHLSNFERNKQRVIQIVAQATGEAHA